VLWVLVGAGFVEGLLGAVDGDVVHESEGKAVGGANVDFDDLLLFFAYLL